MSFWEALNAVYQQVSSWKNARRSRTLLAMQYTVSAAFPPHRRGAGGAPRPAPALKSHRALPAKRETEDLNTHHRIQYRMTLPPTLRGPGVKIMRSTRLSANITARRRARRQSIFRSASSFRPLPLGEPQLCSIFGNLLEKCPRRLSGMYRQRAVYPHLRPGGCRSHRDQAAVDNSFAAIRRSRKMGGSARPNMTGSAREPPPSVRSLSDKQVPGYRWISGYEDDLLCTASMLKFDLKISLPRKSLKKIDFHRVGAQIYNINNNHYQYYLEGLSVSLMKTLKYSRQRESIKSLA